MNRGQDSHSGGLVPPHIPETRFRHGTSHGHEKETEDTSIVQNHQYQQLKQVHTFERALQNRNANGPGIYPGPLGFTQYTDFYNCSNWQRIKNASQSSVGSSSTTTPQTSHSPGSGSQSSQSSTVTASVESLLFLPATEASSSASSSPGQARIQQQYQTGGGMAGRGVNVITTTSSAITDARQSTQPSIASSPYGISHVHDQQFYRNASEGGRRIPLGVRQGMTSATAQHTPAIQKKMSLEHRTLCAPRPQSQRPLTHSMSSARIDFSVVAQKTQNSGVERHHSQGRRLYPSVSVNNVMQLNQNHQKNGVRPIIQLQSGLPLATFCVRPPLPSTNPALQSTSSSLNPSTEMSECITSPSIGSTKEQSRNIILSSTTHFPNVGKKQGSGPSCSVEQNSRRNTSYTEAPTNSPLSRKVMPEGFSQLPSTSMAEKLLTGQQRPHPQIHPPYFHWRPQGQWCQNEWLQQQQRLQQEQRWKMHFSQQKGPLNELNALQRPSHASFRRSLSSFVEVQLPSAPSDQSCKIQDTEHSFSSSKYQPSTSLYTNSKEGLMKKSVSSSSIDRKDPSLAPQDDILGKSQYPSVQANILPSSQNAVAGRPHHRENFLLNGSVSTGMLHRQSRWVPNSGEDCDAHFRPAVAPPNFPKKSASALSFRNMTSPSVCQEGAVNKKNICEIIQGSVESSPHAYRSLVPQTLSIPSSQLQCLEQCKVSHQNFCSSSKMIIHEKKDGLSSSHLQNSEEMLQIEARALHQSYQNKKNSFPNHECQSESGVTYSESAFEKGEASELQCVVNSSLSLSKLQKSSVDPVVGAYVSPSGKEDSGIRVNIGGDSSIHKFRGVVMENVDCKSDVKASNSSMLEKEPQHVSEKLPQKGAPVEKQKVSASSIDWRRIVINDHQTTDFVVEGQNNDDFDKIDEVPSKQLNDTTTMKDAKCHGAEKVEEGEADESAGGFEDYSESEEEENEEEGDLDSDDADNDCIEDARKAEETEAESFDAFCMKRRKPLDFDRSINSDLEVRRLLSMMAEDSDSSVFGRKNYREEKTQDEYDSDSDEILGIIDRCSSVRQLNTSLTTSLCSEQVEEEEDDDDALSQNSHIVVPTSPTGALIPLSALPWVVDSIVFCPLPGDSPRPHPHIRMRGGIDEMLLEGGDKCSDVAAERQNDENAFITNEHRGPYVDVSKWKRVVVNTKQARAERPLINTCVERLGWIRHDQSFTKGNIIWLGSTVPDYEHLQYIRNMQVVNRFPGMWDLTKKRALSSLINLYSELFPTEYDFCPASFHLPDQREEIEHILNPKNKKMFIIKPDGGAMGHGVQLVSRISDIDPAILRGDGHYIVQEYINNPYLIGKHKFDFRIYALLTSVADKPKIFISRHGMGRFCTEPYCFPTRKNMHNPFIHLTNYSINKDNQTKFCRSDDIHSVNNSKRPLKDVFLELKNSGVNIQRIWTQIKDIAIKTFLSLMPWLNLRYRHVYREPIPKASRCFQLVGLDILLDSQEKCWLLEVNSNPSLRIDYFDHKYEGIDIQLESTQDRYIKEPVLTEALAIVYTQMLEAKNAQIKSNSLLSKSPPGKKKGAAQRKKKHRESITSRKISRSSSLGNGSFSAGAACPLSAITNALNKTLTQATKKNPSVKRNRYGGPLPPAIRRLALPADSPLVVGGQNVRIPSGVLQHSQSRSLLSSYDTLVENDEQMMEELRKHLELRERITIEEREESNKRAIIGEYHDSNFLVAPQRNRRSSSSLCVGQVNLAAGAPAPSGPPITTSPSSMQGKSNKSLNTCTAIPIQTSKMTDNRNTSLMGRPHRTSGQPLLSSSSTSSFFLDEKRDTSNPAISLSPIQDEATIEPGDGSSSSEKTEKCLEKEDLPSTSIKQIPARTISDTSTPTTWATEVLNSTDPLKRIHLLQKKKEEEIQKNFSRRSFTSPENDIHRDHIGSLVQGDEDSQKNGKNERPCHNILPDFPITKAPFSGNGRNSKNITRLLPRKPWGSSIHAKPKLSANTNGNFPGNSRTHTFMRKGKSSLFAAENASSKSLLPKDEKIESSQEDSQVAGKSHRSSNQVHMNRVRRCSITGTDSLRLSGSVGICASALMCPISAEKIDSTCSSPNHSDTDSTGCETTEKESSEERQHTDAETKELDSENSNYPQSQDDNVWPTNKASAPSSFESTTQSLTSMSDQASSSNDLMSSDEISIKDRENSRAATHNLNRVAVSQTDVNILDDPFAVTRSLQSDVAMYQSEVTQNVENEQISSSQTTLGQEVRWRQEGVMVNECSISCVANVNVNHICVDFLEEKDVDQKEEDEEMIHPSSEDGRSSADGNEIEEGVLEAGQKVDGGEQEIVEQEKNQQENSEKHNGVEEKRGNDSGQVYNFTAAETIGEVNHMKGPSAVGCIVERGEATKNIEGLEREGVRLGEGGDVVSDIEPFSGNADTSENEFGSGQAEGVAPSASCTVEELETTLEIMEEAKRDMFEYMNCLNVLGLRFVNPLVSNHSAALLDFGKPRTKMHGVVGPYKPYLKRDKADAKLNLPWVKPVYSRVWKDALTPLDGKAVPRDCWIDLSPNALHLFSCQKPIRQCQQLFEKVVDFPQNMALDRSTWLDICRATRLNEIVRRVSVPIFSQRDRISLYSPGFGLYAKGDTGNRIGGSGNIGRRHSHNASYCAFSKQKSSASLLSHSTSSKPQNIPRPAGSLSRQSSGSFTIGNRSRSKSHLSSLHVSEGRKGKNYRSRREDEEADDGVDTAYNGRNRGLRSAPLSTDMSRDFKKNSRKMSSMKRAASSGRIRGHSTRENIALGRQDCVWSDMEEGGELKMHGGEATEDTAFAPSKRFDNVCAAQCRPSPTSSSCRNLQSSRCGFQKNTMNSATFNYLERTRKLGLSDLEQMWVSLMSGIRKLSVDARGLGLLEFWRLLETIALLCFPYLPSKQTLLASAAGMSSISIGDFFSTLCNGSRSNALFSMPSGAGTAVLSMINRSAGARTSNVLRANGRSFLSPLSHLSPSLLTSCSSGDIQHKICDTVDFDAVAEGKMMIQYGSDTEAVYKCDRKKNVSPRYCTTEDSEAVSDNDTSFTIGSFSDVDKVNYRSLDNEDYSREMSHADCCAASNDLIQSQQSEEKTAQKREKAHVSHIHPVERMSDDNIGRNMSERMGSKNESTRSESSSDNSCIIASSTKDLPLYDEETRAFAEADLRASAIQGCENGGRSSATLRRDPGKKRGICHDSAPSQNMEGDVNFLKGREATDNDVGDSAKDFALFQAISDLDIEESDYYDEAQTPRTNEYGDRTPTMMESAGQDTQKYCVIRSQEPLTITSDMKDSSHTVSRFSVAPYCELFGRRDTLNAVSSRPPRYRREANHANPREPVNRHSGREASPDHSIAKIQARGHGTCVTYKNGLPQGAPVTTKPFGKEDGLRSKRFSRAEHENCEQKEVGVDKRFQNRPFCSNNRSGCAFTSSSSNATKCRSSDNKGQVSSTLPRTTGIVPTSQRAAEEEEVKHPRLESELSSSTIQKQQLHSKSLQKMELSCQQQTHPNPNGETRHPIFPEWHAEICSAYPNIGQSVRCIVPSGERILAVRRLINFIKIRLDTQPPLNPLQ